MHPPNPDARALLSEVTERLDGWIFEARADAFSEMFGGPDAVLTEAELAELDRLDSAASRWTGAGVWGTDEYGVAAADPAGTDPGLRVVCTYHPELPDEAYRGAESLDEETRERYDALMWEYAERVADGVQDRLEAYLARTSADDGESTDEEDDGG